MPDVKVSATLRLIDDLASDNEVRILIAIHYFRAEKAKQLMREAGFGVTGTDILETTKQVLMEVSNAALPQKVRMEMGPDTEQPTYKDDDVAPSLLNVGLGFQKPKAKQRLDGLVWAIAMRGTMTVKMRFDSAEQENAFVAGIEADEPLTKKETPG